MSADEVFADYRSEIARANAALVAVADTEHALDRKPAAWPVEIWPDWRLPDVRNVLLHVVTELSCHAGHLDAARELIDGKTWFSRDPFTR